MKVLHVIPGLAARQGGPAVTVTAACLALQRAGIQTAIFATDQVGPASSRRPERATIADLPGGAEGLDVRLVPAAMPQRFAYAPKLYKALRSEASLYDVMHIHSLYLYPTFAAFRVARKEGLPYIVSPHGALDPALRHRSRRVKAINDRMWQRRMIDGAAVIHYTTDEEAELVADLGFRTPQVVVSSGIDCSEFKTQGDAAGFRDRYLDGFDGSIILSLGRISHKKGNDILIRALPRITESDRWIRLVIAGPDDERLSPQLEALAAAEGVNDRVVFTGMLRERERLAAFAAASVWALPSKTENFGLAVIEAMAAGLPVVISHEVNLAPAVQASDAGVVCERSPHAFAVAINRLLDCERRRLEMGLRARTFAQRYDWGVVAPKFLEMYVAASDTGLRTHSAEARPRAFSGARSS